MAVFRVPTVMEKHGKNLVMENGQRNSYGNILKKSWNFSTAYHEREVSIIACLVFRFIF